MSIDGFLTLLTLLIGIYTLLPKIARLRLRLGGIIQIVIAILSVLFIILLYFNSQIISVCNDVFEISCGYFSKVVKFNNNLFSYQELSFITVFGWALLATGVYTFFSRLKLRCSLPTVSKIVGELLFTKRHGELIDFIEPWLPKLKQISQHKSFLQKFHDKICSLNPEAETQRIKQLNGIPDNIPVSDKWKSVQWKVLHFIEVFTDKIPHSEKSKSKAIEIIHSLCRSKDLLIYTTQSKPYFGLLLLKASESHEYFMHI